MMFCVNVFFFPLFRSKPCAFHQFQTKTCMSHSQKQEYERFVMKQECQITATDKPNC